MDMQATDWQILRGGRCGGAITQRLQTVAGRWNLKTGKQLRADS
jgi:hypothetical protein